jgi:hypothetical protein
MGETDPMRMPAATALAALLLASACGSSDSEGSPGPEAAVTRLLTALEAGSCEDVKDVVVTPDLVDCEMIADLKGGYADDGVDLADVRTSRGEVFDGSTTVTVDLGGDEADQTWQVERVGGAWKVLFDSEE